MTTFWVKYRWKERFFAPLSFSLLFLVLPFSPFSQSEISDFKEVDFLTSSIEHPEVDNRRHYMDVRVDFDLYLNAIEHSGKVISRGPQVDYLNQLTEGIAENRRKPIVLVRSNVAGTFSSETTIYITTGLISHLKKPDQLKYFLARELVSEKRSDFWIDRKRYRLIGASYDEKLFALMKRTPSEELELDRKASELATQLDFDPFYSRSCLELLLYSHLPFDNREIPIDYFNTQEYYVPPAYFTQRRSYRTPSINSFYDTTLIWRINKVDLSKEMLIGANEITPEFNELVKTARYDYLEEALIKGEFEVAIYVVFLLESMYSESTFLTDKKCHAWHGFILRNLDVIPIKSESYYYVLTSSEINFFQILRRLPTPARVSIALRIINDHRDTSDEIEALWENLVYHANEYPFFDLREFSSSSYYELFRSSGSPLFKGFNNSQHSVAKADSVNFYLYGLADCVRNNSFWKSLESRKTAKVDTESSFTIFPSVSIVKKFKTHASKSDKKFNQLIEELEGEEAFSSIYNFNALDKESILTLKRSFSQHYALSDYSLPTTNKLKLNNHDWEDQESDYLVFPLFQSTLRPQFRSFYIIGLFVAPIPFVVSHLLLKMHQSTYTVMILDAEDLSVVYTEYAPFYEPLSATNMKLRIKKSINQLNRIQ